MVTSTKPAKARKRIVGCFLEYDGKFAILLRHSHKPDGNTWGLPTGKVEDDETDQQAILRELHEETGYKAAPIELQHLCDFDFRATDGTDCVYVTFRVELSQPHTIKLEDVAHADHKWVTADEFYAMTNLTPGNHALLEFVGLAPPVKNG